MSREFHSFHITASSDPVAGRILRERLTERGLAEEQSGLKIELAVKPELAAESFALHCEPERAYASVAGGDLLGLLYGVGKFLRSQRWRAGGFGCSALKLAEKPERRLRQVYCAGHFHNFWQVAPEPVQRRCLEDLVLWGANSVHLLILPVIDFDDDWENPQLKAQMDKMAALVRSFAAIGLKISTDVYVNQSFRNTPKELYATPNTDPRRGNNGRNVCISKPEGHEYVMRNFRNYLERVRDLPIHFWRFWPYDEGGCTCEACSPWGSNGFLRTAEEMAREIRAVRPDARFIVSTWTFDRQEWEGLAARMRENPWIDYVVADGHGDFPRWPLEHELPGGVPLITFPEISMWGLGPWGGFGATVLPRHFTGLWNQVKGKAQGCMLYSEGIYEDLNKVIELQFYWNDRPAEATLREYADYELYGADPEEFPALCRLLELDHVNDPDAAPAGLAQKALALAKKLDAALPETGRRSWRWRLIYLRAVLDVERLVGRTVQSETAVAALRELIAIYGLPKYSEELGPMHRAIRPPLYE